jgi:hypothetical protein
MRRLVAVELIIVFLAMAAPLAMAQSTRPAPPTSAPSTQSTDIAAPTSRPVTSAEVAELFKQLSSPDWRQRRTAREALVRLGEEARDSISSLIPTAPDEESKHQAQEALAQIDTNRVLGPSYITAHFKNAHPREVFAELSRQCHAPLLTTPDNLWVQGNFPVLTLDIDHQPFWEVMPKICQQFNVDLRPDQTSLRLMRTGGNLLLGLSHVDGPFLVVADRIVYTRTRNLGAKQNQQSNFNITFTIYPEPKITLLRGLTTTRLIEVVDDHGNSLVPAVSSPSSGSTFGGSGAAQLYATLKYPDRNPGTKITRFRATASFMVQTKVQEIQIPDMLKMKDYPVSVAGLQIVFKELHQKDGGYELKLSIAPTQPNSPNFQNIYEQVQSNLQLLDHNGNPLPHRGIATSPIAGRPLGVDISLQFGISPFPGRPEKLMWNVPIEAKQISVPINFTDVPLFDTN